MRPLILTLVLVMTSLIPVRAQEVIATSGASFQNGSASITWTLGEVAVETFTSEELILTQGFNQARLTVTSVEPELISGMDIQAFPNPANDFLKVTLGEENFKTAELNFYDISGRMILQHIMHGQEAEVSLNSLGQGVYFLRVVAANQEVKTFKIVKN